MNMEKSKASLEEMCARLVLEDEEGEEILVGEEEVVKTKESFILVGRFLTDKNINFRRCSMFCHHYGGPERGWKYMI